MPDAGSLYKKGVVQGSVFVCDDTKVHKAIKDGRSVAAFRNKQVNSETLLLVLSQNCDIVSKSDNYLEIISLKKKNTPSKSVQFVQNYRKLHLPFGDSHYECESELISIVPKSIFDGIKTDVMGELDSRTLDSVIDWRVGRYSRKPFPHNFNEDFIQNYLKSDGNELGEFLESNRDSIDHLHVFVKPDDVEDADEYLVSITALLFDKVTIEKKQEIELVLASHAHVLHEADNRLKMVQVQDELIPEEFEGTLNFCESPDEMSIKDAIVSKRITLDYLCYVEDDEADVE